MSLKKYEAFAKTVEMGSLTKAASALGYTQSAMSHILNSLEAELGFSILQRNRGGIRLTAAGEQLLPKVREILEKQQELDALIARIAGDTAGVVRIGAFTSVAVNWLPGILKAYQADHPAVEIKMFNGDYHDVEHWLEQGQIDVGFLALPGPTGIPCIPLKEDPLVVILPEDHPLAGYDRIPTELIAGEPIISLLENSAQDVSRALGSAGIKPDVKYTTKDDYAIIAMVKAGLGISIMPKLLVQDRADGVVVKELSPAASRTIALGYTQPLLPAAESFCRCVEQWVAGQTGTPG